MDLTNPEDSLLHREEIYRGKIVRLVVDTIRLHGGGEAIREVVRHPGGVVAVPILDDGRLLMIRQFRYALQKYIYEFPAGKLDSRLSPEETIRRELEEETGHRAKELAHQFAFYPSPGISDEVIHVYIARHLEAVPQRLEEGEHITPVACTLPECMQKLREDKILDGKSLLALLWYQMNFSVK